MTVNKEENKVIMYTNITSWKRRSIFKINMLKMDNITEEQLLHLQKLYRDALEETEDILSTSSDEEMTIVTTGRRRRNAEADVMKDVDEIAFNELKNLRDVHMAALRGEDNLTPEEEGRYQAIIQTRTRRNGCTMVVEDQESTEENLNARRNSIVNNQTDNRYVNYNRNLRRNAVPDILQTVEPGWLDNIRNVRYSSSGAEGEDDSVTSSMVPDEQEVTVSVVRRNGMANISDTVDMDLLNELRNRFSSLQVDGEGQATCLDTEDEDDDVFP